MSSPADEDRCSMLNDCLSISIAQLAVRLVSRTTCIPSSFVEHPGITNIYVNLGSLCKHCPSVIFDLFNVVVKIVAFKTKISFLLVTRFCARHV